MSNSVPDWAKKWRKKGTTIQMVGDLCCLYKIKTFREKGKKYPTVKREYLGVITPEGVKIKVDVNIDKGDIEEYEAGYTDFILDNAPENLVIGKLGISEEERKRKEEEIIKEIILVSSPSSYLKIDNTLPDNFDERTISTYKDRLEELMGISYKEIECLKGIRLLVFSGGEKARTKMNEEQLSLYRKYSLPLPWEKHQINS